MITIGRQFPIKGHDDLFVRVRFKCWQCKRKCRAILIDTVALEVAAGRIVCSQCDMSAWITASVTLLKNGRDMPEPKQVALEYNILC